MQISANSLRVKDTIIQELKQALSRAAAEEHIPWDKAKLKKTLHVAMLTINSLQVGPLEICREKNQFRSIFLMIRSDDQHGTF